MHKEYWAYQKRRMQENEYPWAILIDKDWTVKKPDTIELTASIYLETIDNPLHCKVVDIGHCDHVSDYLEKLVIELGDLSIVTSADREQLADFIIDVLIH